jgi:hypothetical protein
MNQDGVLAGLAQLMRDMLLSLGAPAVTPFLAEWPMSVGCRATMAARDLPVLRWMTDVAADGTSVGGSVIAALYRHMRALDWRQTYAAGQIGDEFLRNYGWTEILGLHTGASSTRIACGFLLLGPATCYPRHRHEAQEIYVPLSGTASWQQGDGIWQDRPPGSVIHHASEEPHAMQTKSRPLLALYVWRSANLNQEARLESMTGIEDPDY